MGNQWFEKARLASLAAILTFGVGGTAAAQTLPDGNDDEWHFTIAPYLFLPVTTSGTATVAGAERSMMTSSAPSPPSIRLALLRVEESP